MERARDEHAPARESDTSMAWSDLRLVGYTPMDETHEEFYEVVFALVTCDPETLVKSITAVEAHTVSHFEQEDEWMRSTDFPPHDCHIDEHAAVLKSIREVKAGIEAGAMGVEHAHDLGHHLFAWFPGHADYLDSALAAWLTKLRMGGKPVVLRRSI